MTEAGGELPQPIGDHVHTESDNPPLGTGNIGALNPDRGRQLNELPGSPTECTQRSVDRDLRIAVQTDDLDGRTFGSEHGVRIDVVGHLFAQRTPKVAGKREEGRSALISEVEGL